MFSSGLRQNYINDIKNNKENQRNEVKYENIL